MDFTARYVQQENKDHTFICKKCKAVMSGKYLLEPRCPVCGSTLSMGDKVEWYTPEQEAVIARRIVRDME